MITHIDKNIGMKGFLYFLSYCSAFYMLLAAGGYAWAQPADFIIGRWQLQQIHMHQLTITAEELRSKRLGNTMIFAEDGVCQIVPDNTQAKVITNRWQWLKPGEELLIEGQDAVGRAVRQRFRVERRSRRLLILRIGEGVDEEAFVYQRLK